MYEEVGSSRAPVSRYRSALHQRLTGHRLLPEDAVRGTLERDGLIVRERIESDRRQVLVRLTAEGTERLKSGIDAQVSRDQKWFAVLSEEEQHVFGEMLQRLADQVFPDREEAASD
jgi:hypothetical protein